MTYTAPPARNPGDPITASDYNTYIKDNIIYHHARPGDDVLRDNGSSYTTNSTSFVDVDATNLKKTVNMKGAAVLVGLAATCEPEVNQYLMFDIDVDGTRYAAGGANGLCQVYGAAAIPYLISFAIRIPGLAAGSHTFKLKWRQSGTVGGTSKLYSGSGSGQSDSLIDFWVQEVA